MKEKLKIDLCPSAFKPDHTHFFYFEVLQEFAVLQVPVYPL